MRWLAAPPDALVFARDPGFVFAANLGTDPLPLPAHKEVLLTSGPLDESGAVPAALPRAALPPNTAAWLRSG
jgi:alpha-glucosidase